MFGLNPFRKRETGPTVYTDHKPPRDTEALVHQQAEQIIHLRAALREIEHLPPRSRRFHEIARRARMARPGDYFKERARAERAREIA